jgi:hypothetical protein
LFIAPVIIQDHNQAERDSFSRWEDYFQGMERTKQDIPDITPNLVK